MAFIYPRTVRFQDTDAAGVVYFANVLSMCHEAYEASLGAAGVDLKSFFSVADIALPIVHASVDFFKPMFCGDRLDIHLTARSPHADEFELDYQIFAIGAPKPLSVAFTRHVCIHRATRSRHPLPDFLPGWCADCGAATASTPVDG